VADVKYTYDAAFQGRIVSLFLRDPAFLHDYRDVIDPGYFESEALTVLTRLSLNFFEKTNEIPNRDTLREIVKEYCVEYRVGDRLRGEVETVMEEVYRVDLSNVAAVRQKVVTFGQRQALRLASLEIAELTKKDEGYEEARGIVGRALQVGTCVQDRGVHLGTDLLQLPQIARASTYSFSQKIPTMFPTLDRYTGGGLSRKETWIFGAASGIGKSTILVQLGAAALAHGFKVLHFTIGDLDEVDVELRYASRVTSCTIPEIIKADPKYMERAQMRARYNLNLWVKDYASGKATLAKMESYLSWLAYAKGFVPDMIIWDYPDEMEIGEDLYRDVGDIYAGIQRISRDYNALSVTASQVKVYTSGDEDHVLKMDDLDHSKLKYAKADGVITLNQTRSERGIKKARLWVDKTRRWRSFYLMELACDYDISSMREVREVTAFQDKPLHRDKDGDRKRGRRS
jgi:replicative DNA helicase